MAFKLPTLGEFFLMVLSGTGVVVLAPVIAGFLGNFEPLTGILATEIIPDVISIGLALAAGIAHLIVQLVVETFIKKKVIL